MNHAIKKKKALDVWKELATSINGLSIEILKSSSKNLEGLRGTVISETANMIRLKTQDRMIWIQKNNHVFRIELEDGSKFIIEGSTLRGKPESRIKRKFQTW